MVLTLFLPHPRLSAAAGTAVHHQLRAYRQAKREQAPTRLGEKGRVQRKGWDEGHAEIVE